MKIFTSQSEKQTLGFAKNLAKTLKGGEVIGLIGDLGVGKTVFARGLARGLGIKRKINSPTFVLLSKKGHTKEPHNNNCPRDEKYFGRCS